MFDPEIIQGSPAAQQAIKLLLHSGVIEKQISRLQETMLAGDPDAEPEELAYQIRRFRRQVNSLESLRAIALEYQGEE